MKPVIIEHSDDAENVKKKIMVTVDDIYKKFETLNQNVYDFTADAPVDESVFSIMDAEDNLNQTISGSYTQSEIQAISDKVDALLAKLRSANILAE